MVVRCDASGVVMRAVAVVPGVSVLVLVPLPEAAKGTCSSAWQSYPRNPLLLLFLLLLCLCHCLCLSGVGQRCPTTDPIVKKWWTVAAAVAVAVAVTVAVAAAVAVTAATVWEREW